MSTVNKEIADDIIAGKYPEDKAFKIVEYENAFGGTSYGVCFHPYDSPHKYRASHFVRNPRIYWEIK